MTRWALLTAAVLLSQPVQAQQLTLEISGGRVTLDASNVPVRQILAEWARVGGTTVVNGERVVGAPVTLTLVDMPEKQALEIVLRNVAGYMAAARADLGTGASEFDRILVLPTSTAPAATAAAAPTSTGRPTFAPGNPALSGTQRIIRGPIVQQPSEDESYAEEEVEMAPPEGGNIFVPTSPNPMPFGQPGQPFRFPTGGNPNSPIITTPADGQAPAQPPAAPVGSSVPGVVTAPPPPRPPG